MANQLEFDHAVSLVRVNDFVNTSSKDNGYPFVVDFVHGEHFVIIILKRTSYCSKTKIKNQVKKTLTVPRGASSIRSLGEAVI